MDPVKSTSQMMELARAAYLADLPLRLAFDRQPDEEGRLPG